MFGIELDGIKWEQLEWVMIQKVQLLILGAEVTM